MADQEGMSFALFVLIIGLFTLACCIGIYMFECCQLQCRNWKENRCLNCSEHCQTRYSPYQFYHDREEVAADSERQTARRNAVAADIADVGSVRGNTSSLIEIRAEVHADPEQISMV